MLYDTQYYQLCPESEKGNSARGNTIFVLFWTSEVSINLPCMQLFIPQRLVLHHSLPLQGLPAARAPNSYSCPANKKCQAAEQSPFKILQYSSIHWLSFKTLRVNPTVFNATLIQQQTCFHSNGRVSKTEVLRYTPRKSKMPLLKRKYVHRAVIPNLDPKYSMSMDPSLPLRHLVPGFTHLDQGHQLRLPKSRAEPFQVLCLVPFCQ